MVWKGFWTDAGSVEVGSRIRERPENDTEDV